MPKGFETVSKANSTNNARCDHCTYTKPQRKPCNEGFASLVSMHSGNKSAQGNPDNARPHKPEADKQSFGNGLSGGPGDRPQSRVDRRSDWPSALACQHAKPHRPAAHASSMGELPVLGEDPTAWAVRELPLQPAETLLDQALKCCSSRLVGTTIEAAHRRRSAARRRRSAARRSAARRLSGKLLRGG